MLLALLLTCLPTAPALDFTHPPPGWEGPEEWAEVYARASHFAWLAHELVPSAYEPCLRAHALVRLAGGSNQPFEVLGALQREVGRQCGPTGGHTAQVLAEEALGP